MSSLPTIRPDHAQHFVYGTLCSSFVAAVTTYIGGPVAAPVAGILAAAAVGVLKEAADYESNWRDLRHGLPPAHKVSGGDFWAVLLGGCIVAAPQLAQHAL